MALELMQINPEESSSPSLRYCHAAVRLELVFFTFFSFLYLLCFDLTLKSYHLPTRSVKECDLGGPVTMRIDDHFWA
jgi:hypothetical protein